MPNRLRTKWTIAAAALIVPALSVGIAVARPTGSQSTVAAPAGDRPSTESPSPRETASWDRLPDLDQEAPSEVSVRIGRAGDRPRYWLGFRSAVRNIGVGPLILEGARDSTATPTMEVDQVIDRGERPPRVLPEVGRMRYAVSPDHSHWHYLQFERYELQSYTLRPAGRGAAIATDRKTGFCLGDRYGVTSSDLPAAPPRPVYTGSCGRDRPDLLEMREGISVGYGDDYSAFLEGQDLPLDGLPDGQYVLVHRVNVNRGLQELTYTNNAASVLLDLRWQGEWPRLRVLASCPDTDHCDHR